MLGIGLNLWASVLAAARQSDPSYDYYVSDAASGSGSGTRADPFTPSQITALSGTLANKKIGVKRGSVFGGSVILTIAASDNGIQIGAYGSGAAPIFDCSDAIAGSWTNVATNVWQITVSQQSNAKASGNLFRDDTPMQLVQNRAALTSSGQAYAAAWGWAGTGIVATTSLVIEIYSTVDPGGDGHAYRYTRWLNAIALSGSGCTVQGVTAKRNLHQDGSITLGGSGLIYQSRLEDGCRHSALVGGNSRFVDTYFKRAINAQENGQANFATFFQNDITAATVATSGCTFDDGGLGGVMAIDAHDATAGHLALSAQHDNDIFIGCGMSNANAQTVTFNNPVVVGATTNLISQTNSGSAVVINNISGSLSGSARVLNASVAGSLNISGSLQVAQVDNGVFLSTVSAADFALTLNGFRPDLRGVGSSNYNFVALTRGPLTVTGCTIGPVVACPIANLFKVGIGQTGVLVSSNNTLPIGAKWLINGTTYNTLADAQAAGYESGSVEGAIPVSIASDQFTRADESLETSAPWTRTGGAAAQLGVRSSQLAALGTTQTMYDAGAMASADHWARCTVKGAPASAGPLLGVREKDASNWGFGLRWSSAAYSTQSCSAGSFTTGGSIAGITPANDDDIIVAARGGIGYAYWKPSGANAWRQIVMATVSTNLAETKAGFVARGSTQNPLADNFSCGIAA